MTTSDRRSGRTRSAPGSPLAAGGLITLLVLDLAYFINAADRQVFPVLAPDIRADLGFGTTEVGLLTTIFTLGMGLAGIPAGLLSDRWGRKNVILAGLLVFSAATAAQAVAVGLADMTVFRVLSGFGEGLQASALFAATGSYFHRRRGLALGSLSAAYGVGAFLGPITGGALLGPDGDWKTPLVVFGAVGALVMVAVWIAVPRTVADHRAPNPSGASAMTGPLDRLFNRTIICCAITASACGILTFAFHGLYPTYLREVLGLSSADTGVATGLFGVGALSAVVWGPLTDRLDQRRLNIAGLITLIIVGLLIFLVARTPGAQMVLSTLVGVTFSGVIFTNTNSFMQRSVHPSMVGRASGVFFAALYIPAAASGYVFASIVETLGWSTAGTLLFLVPGSIGVLAMLAIDPPPWATFRSAPRRGFRSPHRGRIRACSRRSD